LIAVERAVAAPPERVFDFLAVGGRAWFEGLFRRALENLDEVL
jgi:hypothetical protein